MNPSVFDFPPQVGAEIHFEPRYKDLTSEALIQRCATSADAHAWNEFIRRFHPLISGVVARTAMRWTTVSPDLVDDLVQETYLKLCTKECQRLKQFSSRHENALYGFLKTVAYNVTVDYFKSRWAAKRGGRQFQDSDFDCAQATAAEGSLEHHVLLQQLEQCLEKIAHSPRDRLVFRLYYQQGFTSAAIAAIPAIGLSEKGVVSCIFRLTGLLRKHVRKTDALKGAKLLSSGPIPLTELN
ncbi:MAG TPA: sigma-70 family RNA polymerase sigma factor [Candidatus Angelobacter sp.]|jgi:RNA polymerase sigma-70 factor (ECF subfamily)|nr:sigma-70 family RNA polymerase sigma factor [Candidatus Angelobacter sp.]